MSIPTVPATTAGPDATAPTERTYLVQFGDHLPHFRSFEITCAVDDIGAEIHNRIDPGGNWDFEVRVTEPEDGVRHARVVNDDDSESGYGTLTITEVAPVAPDYWTEVAADLRQVADRVATLAGTPVPDTFGPYLSLYSDSNPTHLDRSVQVVNALARALDAAAETNTEGRGGLRSTERRMKGRLGRIRLVASAAMPNPPTRAEKLRSRAELAEQNAALQAELAKLRAAQAGGAA